MPWPRRIVTDMGAAADRGLLLIAQGLQAAAARIASWIKARRARRAGYGRQR